MGITKISTFRIPEKLKRDALAKGRQEGFNTLTSLIIYLLSQFVAGRKHPDT